MSRDFLSWFNANYAGDFDADSIECRAVFEAYKAGYQAAEPNWIPYKEGDEVPKGRYLVTTKGNLSGRVFIEDWVYANNRWPLGSQVSVTAYRPLPEPYEGGVK